MRRHKLETHDGPPYEAQDNDTNTALIAKGVDIFAFEEGAYCNGPRCVVCKEAKCHHHYPEWWKEECQ